MALKKTVLSLCFLLVSLLTPLTLQAGQATLTLTAIVNEMLLVMQTEGLSEGEKKAAVELIVDRNVDFGAVSQRVIGKHWRTSADVDKAEFKSLFRNVLTNTYYVLLSSYTDEEVVYLSEKIKKERYATVNTQILSGGKKIPVSYRMINRDGQWKIYDFVAEGISLVRNYGNTYKATLKKQGLAGLNKSLMNDQQKEG